MRAALWLMGLFAAAVALALFAGNNQGTVTLFWPPHRIDVSANLALLLLLLAFGGLYVALRTLGSLLELPRQARQWRAQQRERATHALLMDAMVQFSAGRFLRARKAAEGALAREQALADRGQAPAHAPALRALAHMAMAESAHALQDRAVRDQHLDRALAVAADHASTPELREGVLLRASRWALNDGDPGGAMARLDELPHGAHRRAAALRIKLKAARQAGRIGEALETARLLSKHRAFSPEAARSLMRSLATEWVRDARDAAQLQQVWDALSPAERAMPELALRAAQRMLALGGDHAVVRRWLRPVAERMLEQPHMFSDADRVRMALALEAGMVAVGDASDQEWLARIELASQTHPRDAVLQYLAGMACVHRHLWGRAQVLLTQALRGLDDATLRRQAWRALAEMAEHRGDAEAAAQAWKQSASV
jgi:HemY protein